MLELYIVLFFQAEDGIRDVERSRGLGDVYKRQDYWGIFPGENVVLCIVGEGGLHAHGVGDGEDFPCRTEGIDGDPAVSSRGGSHP